MSFKRIQPNTVKKWNEWKIRDLNDEQRKAVNERENQSLCVVAGAGSGKTRVLTYRFLDLIINDGLKPWEIACLTYTTAAADEMKDRIIRKLVDLSEFELLREIETSYISTIHAFALRLITENSLLTGFDSSFLDLSAVERNLLMRESYDLLSERILQEFNDEHNDLFNEYSFGNIAHSVYKLIEVMRDNGLGVEHLEELHNMTAGELTDMAVKKNLSIDFKTKGQSEFSFIEKIRKPILSLAIQEFQRLKDIKQQMRRFEFIDYLESLNNLLHNEKSAVQRQFKEILVDEFQDTNDFQYSLVRDICHENARIFTVGDAKQSIYRFQQAEINVFANFAASKHTKLLELKTNYRSHEDLIEFCNQLFKPAMLATKREIDFEKIDAPLQPGKINKEKENIPRVEVLLVNRESREIDEKKNKRIDMNFQAHDLKADFIARRIKKLVQNSENKFPESFEFKDIAILVRKKSTALKYRTALNKLGIPALIFGGMNLLRQPVVLDAFYILKFLVHQTDDINFAAVLKTPFVGVSDDVLYWLSQKKREFQNVDRKKFNDDKLRLSLFETARRLYNKKSLNAEKLLPSEVFGDAGTEEIAKFNKYLDLLHNFFESYSSFENHLTEMNALEILDIAMNKLDFVHRIAAYTDDRTAEANFHAFRDLIKELEQRNDYLFSELVTHLQKLIDMQIDVEEAAPSSGLIENERDAVRIMTIHKAKGLEFPAVFVVETEEDVSNEREYDIEGKNVGAQSLFVDRDFGLCGKFYRFKKDGDLTLESKTYAYHQDLYEKRKRENLLESFRMFYVAMTRAERLLFIAGTCKFEENSKTIENFLSEFHNENLEGVNFDTLVSLMKQGTRTKNFCSYLRKLLNIENSPFFEDQRDLNSEKKFEDFRFKNLNVRRWFYIDPSELQEENFEEILENKDLTKQLKHAYEISQKEFKPAPSHFNLNTTELAHLMTCPKMFDFSVTEKASAFDFLQETHKIVKDAEEKTLDAKELGIEFHKIFEKADYSSFEAFSQSVESATHKHQGNQQLHSQLQELTASVLGKKEFWKNICNADKIYTELPVFVTHANITFNGVIDLLAEFNNKLVLLDFKTDKNYAEEVLRFRYENQLKLYCFVLFSRLQKIKQKKNIEFTMLAVRQKSAPILIEYNDETQEEIVNKIEKAFKTLSTGEFLAKISKNCKFCFYAGICQDYKLSKKTNRKRKTLFE